jgi:hypothetical protein
MSSKADDDPVWNLIFNPEESKDIQNMPKEGLIYF